MGIKAVREHIQKYAGVRKSTIYEGNRKVILYTARAKRTTPVNMISLNSPWWKNRSADRRVHVATHVPSTNRSFTFKSKYAIVKSASAKRVIRRKPVRRQARPWWM